MNRAIIFTLLIISTYISLGESAHAASGDIDGWRITYENMNCVADGSALDPGNNYVWTVRLAHPVQNQLRLLIGLYNSEVAEKLRGNGFKDDIKLSLSFNSFETEANDFMVDDDGAVVLEVNNSSILQREVSENTRISIIMQQRGDPEKYILSTLHVMKAKPAFEWLQKCAVFGLNSIPG